MRHFLLKKADRYDLETLKGKPSYAGLDPGFRDAIEKALEEAAPGGTRTRTYDIQTVEKAEETLMSLNILACLKTHSVFLVTLWLSMPLPEEKPNYSKKAFPKMLPVMSQALCYWESLGRSRAGGLEHEPTIFKLLKAEEILKSLNRMFENPLIIFDFVALDAPARREGQTTTK